ncbi:MAG: pitrilysin family protein [Gemmataceae bacterium]
MIFHHNTLPNGLTIIGEVIPAAQSVAVGFFVKTGSRDESEDVWGVSHFLEHMVFKGTQRRNYLDVNIEFDSIGAMYNAFTSEENTVFYAAVLPEYLPRAVDLLSDILRPALRGEDFNMEKKVILEEIGMYEDQPMWCAYELAKKAYFAGHPLGRSVLGTNHSITELTRDQMQAYFDRRYVAPNITVALAGNFDWEAAVALIEKHCGGWPRGAAPRGNRRELPGSAAFEVVPKKKVNQEHVFMISPAPSASSPLRHAADVLAMILGDDSGSRLYWSVVDRGLADSADVGFHDYDGTGTFFTSYTCEPKNAQKVLGIIQGVFRQTQHDGVSEEELAQAKSKVLSRIVRASERPMGRMQALGMSWTYLKKYRSMDDELKAFEAVTTKKIDQVLEKYSLEKPTVLALGPLKTLKKADVKSRK